MYEYAMLLVYKDGQRETICPQATHFLDAKAGCYRYAKEQGRELEYEPMFLGYRAVTPLTMAAAA